MADRLWIYLTVAYLCLAVAGLKGRDDLLFWPTVIFGLAWLARSILAFKK